ncbi:Hypothetical protein CINCED_3A022118 [Cinara cedri]|uniref:Uncharacterized protein n=1 Tax=Cinara cedri TaxID=506608 RepID=A0A5E4M516_9HEMI|nr:Hypothetical protein CINCED_3A022118 [Cinara cedri]
MDFASRYKNYTDFTIFTKMIVAFSFVSIEDLDATIEHYVGRVNRNGRGRWTVLFPPHIWNLHLRVLNGQNRPNNHVEAANKWLNVEMEVQHPSLWSFINCL